MKRSFLIIITFILIFPTLTVYASSSDRADQDSEKAGEVAAKDEIVYVNLHANGELSDIYVVNYLQIAETGMISDFGPYSVLKNLTDLSELQFDGSEVILEATSDSFYYQGNIEQDIAIPWDISIEYFLEGNKIEADDLVGQDGFVEIELDIKANEKAEKAFFENYMLQISFVLHEEHFKNIQAADATIAHAGKNKQVSFTVMPENEATYTVRADADSFEMDGIEVAAIPASMSIDLPDTGAMTDDINTLSKAISELHGGVGSLRNGAHELADGIVQLGNGSSQFQKGMSEVAGAGGELVHASSSIDKALKEINSALQVPEGNVDISDFTELTVGLEEMAQGLDDVVEGLNQLTEHYTLANQALDEAISSIPASDISEEEIGLLYQSGADVEVVNKLVAQYTAAQTVKGTYEAVQEAFHAVTPALKQSSAGLSEIVTHLRQMAEGLEDSFEDFDVADSLEPLVSGLTELSNQYQLFHQGLTDYTSGVTELSTSYGDLNGGLVEIATGAKQLADGTDDLYDGTAELEEATADMPDQVEEQINELMSEFDKSDFEMISFVSEENNDKINSVQFVMRTESLKADEETTSDEQEEEKLSFWQKLLRLFGLGTNKEN
ncbi:X-X-X-Leu-X-X-Gly heptad repeat-containing protein [Alkalihalobacillus pseudalcaliphilus]|uniref:X-X-X-Leu-X-X-Gly heptad repeat-containing protein n=1 Tax=Alkalihalobacillus pseudalcaliphilus TaxID=79884 RepID=UPI00064DC28A|nr:X-X-X-Leu-X-X-Gly heptad repeat-containing protein [Alkalihalobacillus pseudalcaliphilus]KMK76836.1 X-X-X-Leu-X-X-Gly heptad repeat-containing protein [Alkalihalobacillus pseudalcaliphilus]